jgi:AraC family transcriptional regulator of adaptative response/methylated-DNA-[protein]-cysteine methyltransferase
VPGRSRRRIADWEFDSKKQILTSGSDAYREVMEAVMAFTMYASEMEARTRVAIDPDAAWAAVMGRDGQRDGTFVYAVTTTGVYCRPTCPSRRPHRQNVLFFDVPDAAERAGFRPCRRCKPRDEAAPTAAMIEKVRTYIEANLDARIMLSRLARLAGVSTFHLQRTFKRETGLSPAQYAAARRAERFRQELKQGANVTRATYDAGYSSSSRLYAVSNAQLGMTPSTYRRGGRGMHIRYATADTAFGRLPVAATERGVCFVELGDDEKALEAGLAAEYPLASREQAPAEMGEWMSAVLATLDGASPRAVVAQTVGADTGTADTRTSETPSASRRGATFPLDVKATDFKWRVWRALQEIPYGETRTYAEVAAAIGAPRAVRAVANACATNNAALVIPCHRVIGSNGTLTGYRWGVDRKRQLLEHEREQAGRHSVGGDSGSAGRGHRDRDGIRRVRTGSETGGGRATAR